MLKFHCYHCFLRIWLKNHALFSTTFYFIMPILTMLLIIPLHQTQQQDNLLMERGSVEEGGLPEGDNTTKTYSPHKVSAVQFLLEFLHPKIGWHITPSQIPSYLSVFIQSLLQDDLLMERGRTEEGGLPEEGNKIMTHSPHKVSAAQFSFEHCTLPISFRSLNIHTILIGKYTDGEGKDRGGRVTRGGH